MPRRTAFVLIGMPHSGVALIEAALSDHAATIEQLGFQRPARSADEMFRAAVELTRAHRAWGYRRRDVEGSWAAICRRARKGRGAVLVGQQLLAGAARVEIDLLLDGLAGFEVHVIAALRTPRPHERIDEEDLGEVLGRWAGALGRADRVHVLVVPEGPDRDRALWDGYGRVVGLANGHLGLPARTVTVAEARLPFRHLDPGLLRRPAEGPHEVAEGWAKQLAAGGFDLHGDPIDLVPQAEPAPATERAMLEEALADSLVEAADLRARNEALVARNAKLERTRKKLRRRLADVVTGL